MNNNHTNIKPTIIDLKLITRVLPNSFKNDLLFNISYSDSTLNQIIKNYAFIYDNNQTKGGQFLVKILKILHVIFVHHEKNILLNELLENSLFEDLYVKAKTHFYFLVTK